MITKIISGGQTGADRGGLEAAKLLGIETGGWAPLNFRTEAGVDPSLGTEFGLVAMDAYDYLTRTKGNVEDSDGTLIFGDVSSPGSRATLNECRRHGKPVLVLDWKTGDSIPEPEVFRDWVEENDIKVLNVAGNRESKQSGIRAAVRSFLLSALG